MKIVQKVVAQLTYLTQQSNSPCVRRREDRVGWTLTSTTRLVTASSSIRRLTTTISASTIGRRWLIASSTAISFRDEAKRLEQFTGKTIFDLPPGASVP